MSATFYEPGYEHFIEVIHQRDAYEHRRLASLDVAIYAPDGAPLYADRLDPAQETIDLSALVDGLPGAPGRALVVFDARYDETIFPYRPHHYGYLHRRGGGGAPLYYAVNAVLGGVPDRIGATNINNFEMYLFSGPRRDERLSVLLGNVSRFATAEGEVATHHGALRTAWSVVLGPKSHAEFDLPAERDGHRLDRVELKAGFRLASYVVGRREGSGELVLFDHLFTYAR